MEQLHRRLTDEQIRLIFKNYCEGHVSRTEAQETIGVGKSQFFVLLKAYRQAPADFSVGYQRHTPGKLAEQDEQAIRQELKREKELVEDPRLPISSYNYTALRDRLKRNGIEVSLPTIIKRARNKNVINPGAKERSTIGKWSPRPSVP
jgi:transposase